MRSRAHTGNSCLRPVKASRGFPVGLLLAVLFFALACVSVPAQRNERTLAQFQHTSWATKDGAPTIVSLAQTTDGYLWIGSMTGLYRFDGVRFERYVPPNGQQIRSGPIDALMATSDGGLWIGWAHSGATFLHDGRITEYGTPDSGAAPGKVFEFAVDRDGAVWAASFEGLARFEGGHARYVSEDWGYTGKNAISILADGDGTLWVSSYDALFYLPRGEKRFQKFSDLPPGGSFSIRQSPDGTIYVANGTNAKPLRGVPSRLIRPLPIQGGDSGRTLPAVFAIDAVSRVLIDGSGSLWIATLEGIFRVAHPELLRQKPIAHFDGEGFERFRAKDGLTADAVETMTQDREGNIWVGTVHGLDRFREANIIPIADSEAPPQLVPEDEGDVWGVTPDFPQAHLLRLHGMSATARAIGASGGTTARGSNGVLWLGGTGALWNYKNGKITPVLWPPGIDPHMAVQAIAEGSSGDLWVSISRTGVFRLQKGTWALNGNLPDLPKATAWTIVADANGGTWFGYANNRLAFADGEHVRNFSEADGLKVGNVQAIQPQAEGIWVGGDRGLALFRNDRLQQFAADEAGVFVGISGIAETRDGDLWLNTSQGIVRVPKPEIQRAIERQGYSMHCETFDSLDGLAGTAPQVRPLPTVVKSSDDRLWFSIFDSVVQIDPAHLHRNTMPPSVLIRSIDSGGKTYVDPTDGVLPLPNSSIHIEYTAPNLSIPQRVRFRYKLEGFDKDWQNAGGRREAFYTNLRPGTYHFHVVACNEDGVWNETGTAVSFRIAPAYYQTIWFELVCAAIVAGLLWLFYLWRLQLATAQIQERLGARMEERERIARELHDTLLQGFQGLMLRFQAVMKTLPAEEPARTMMAQVLDRADEVLLEGRQSVRDLREAGTSEAELPEALKHCGEELAQNHTSLFTLTIVGEPKPLAPVVFNESYRIAREALINAFQHSQARNIEIEVTYMESGISLRVRDDGMGIDAATLSKGRAGHWGLSGMRERAQKIGAQVDIWSQVGAGTEIELKVPAKIAYARKIERSLWQRIEGTLTRNQGNRA